MAFLAMIVYSWRTSYFNSEEYIHGGVSSADEQSSRRMLTAQGILMFLGACAGVLYRLKTSKPNEDDSEVAKNVGAEVPKAVKHLDSVAIHRPTIFMERHNPPSKPLEPQSEALIQIASVAGYELLAKEEATGFRHEALWLKALSEADGNEQVAKARYNQQRASLLEAQETARLRSEAARRAQEAEAEANELKLFESEAFSYAAQAIELNVYKPLSKDKLLELKAKLEVAIPRLELIGRTDLMETCRRALGSLEGLIASHREHEDALRDIALDVKRKDFRSARRRGWAIHGRFPDLDYQQSEQILRRSDLVLLGFFLFIAALCVLGFIFMAVKAKPLSQAKNTEKPARYAEGEPILVPATLKDRPPVSLGREEDDQIPALIPELEKEVAASIDELSTQVGPHFSTSDLPKSRGLTIKGRLPKAWSVRHNSQKHVVISAQPEHEKFSFYVEVLPLDGNGSLRSAIESQEAASLIPPGTTLNGGVACRIDGRPGFQVEFTRLLDYKGRRINTFNRYYWIIIGEHILGLHFVTLESANESNSRFSTAKVLFEKIVEWIVVSEKPAATQKESEQGALMQFKMPKLSENPEENKRLLKEIGMGLLAPDKPIDLSIRPDADVTKPFDLSTRPPFENTLGMRFVPVLLANLWMSIWETRNRDFNEYLSKTGKLSKSSAFGETRPSIEGKDQPVVLVTYAEAVDFCRWLTAKERSEKILANEFEYRLPTDSEWSVAVGVATYPWGEEAAPLSDAGNYRGGEADRVANPDFNVLADMGWRDPYPETSPVGSFRANPLGVFDLGGNVWEWCCTNYDPTQNSEEFLKVFPSFTRKRKDKSGIPLKIVRGSSWFDCHPQQLKSRVRFGESPSSINDCVGFRIVIATTK